MGGYGKAGITYHCVLRTPDKRIIDLQGAVSGKSHCICPSERCQLNDYIIPVEQGGLHLTAEWLKNARETHAVLKKSKDEMFAIIPQADYWNYPRGLADYMECTQLVNAFKRAAKSMSSNIGGTDMKPLSQPCRRTR